MHVIFLLAIGGIILTVGDIIFKSWVEKPHTGMYVLGLAVYLVGLMFLVQSFKFENIAVASTIFVIFNITTLLFFKKKLPVPIFPPSLFDYYHFVVLWENEKNKPLGLALQVSQQLPLRRG